MPLALVSSDPADLSTGNSVEGIITLTFDGAVKEASASTKTVQLYRDDTDRPVTAKIVASGTKVLILPASALEEDTLYQIRVIGSDLGLGYGLQAADSSFLATTISLSFRTGTERYVPLTSVAKATDIERIGPIRESDPLAALITATATPLEITGQDPAPYAPNVSIDLTAIVVTFNQDLDPSSVDNATAKATQLPVLGWEDYYGVQTTGSDGVASNQLLTQQGLCDADPPSLTPTVVGNQLIFLRDPLQQFYFNTQVTVELTTGILSVDGQSLSEDVAYLFTTQYLPLYATPTLIQLEMGPTVSAIEEDTIYRLLHKNSLQAWELTGRSVPLECPPIAVRRWAACRTILDILNVLMQAADLTAGEKKTLGDLTIQRSPRDPKLGALYAEALECLESNPLSAKDSLLAKATVKGSSAPGNRYDHRLRTWDHLLLQTVPGANLVYERFSKGRLSAAYAFAGKDLSFYQGFTLAINASRLAVSGELF